MSSENNPQAPEGLKSLQSMAQTGAKAKDTNGAPPVFDYYSVPKKVSWVLTVPGDEGRDDKWEPFIDGKHAEDDVQRLWKEAYNNSINGRKDA